ncbi:MAG: hypothetical protein HS115_09615 [Spirochaetales bacterium]|nr:hypothetical protein [Spirochaetales bacterium]
MRYSLPVLLFFTSLYCQKNAALELYRSQEAVLQKGLTEVLKGQDFLPQGKTLYVFDFDHTLGDTVTTIPVKTREGTLRQMDSKCMDLAEGEEADYSVFNATEVATTAPIPAAFDLLRRVQLTDTAVIVTARGQSDTVVNLQNYLQSRGAQPVAVIAINTEDVQNHIWKKLSTDRALPGQLKKPFIIAALVNLAGKQGVHFERIEYHEDTDRYVTGSVELLGGLFPQVRIDIFDYIRTPGSPNAYRQEKAISFEKGRWRLPDQRPFREGATYDSEDCPVPAR